MSPVFLLACTSREPTLVLVARRDAVLEVAVDAGPEPFSGSDPRLRDLFTEEGVPEGPGVKGLRLLRSQRLDHIARNLNAEHQAGWRGVAVWELQWWSSTQVLVPAIVYFEPPSPALVDHEEQHLHVAEAVFLAVGACAADGPTTLRALDDAGRVLDERTDHGTIEQAPAVREEEVVQVVVSTHCHGS